MQNYCSTATETTKTFTILLRQCVAVQNVTGDCEPTGNSVKGVTLGSCYM